MSKQDIKDAGKQLGGAFKTFGKTFARSADRLADKINKKEPEGDTTVFSDGSWKQVGREFGSALKTGGTTAFNEVSNLVSKAGVKKDSEKDENGKDIIDVDAEDVTVDGE